MIFKQFYYWFHILRVSNRVLPYHFRCLTDKVDKRLFGEKIKKKTGQKVSCNEEGGFVIVCQLRDNYAHDSLLGRGT